MSFGSWTNFRTIDRGSQKPDNIFLRELGESLIPTVLDFGIAVIQENTPITGAAGTRMFARFGRVFVPLISMATTDRKWLLVPSNCVRTFP